MAKSLPCAPKIYLDNNATTFMSPKTKEIMNKYSSTGNVSAFYPRAQAVKRKIEQLKDRVLSKVLGSAYSQFEVIFTSGASEANATVLRMIADANALRSKQPLQVLTSSIEHHSMLEAVTTVPGVKSIQITPGPTTIITSDLLSSALQEYKDIDLVSIMTANNETGAINPVNTLGRIAHKHGALFHTDATQGFGKLTDQHYNSIDALSMSFHKVYGPIGVGMLLIKKSVIKGYDLHAMIPGTQNNGLRGGTENPGLILAGLTALEETWKARKSKNEKLVDFQLCLMHELGERFDHNIVWFTDFIRDPSKYQGIWIVLFGSKKLKDRMPNTLQFSVYRGDIPYSKKICNIELRRCLFERYKIAVSIGSACLTKSPKASHVLYAMFSDLDNKYAKYLKSGVIRVSFGDNNRKSDCEEFSDALKECLNLQEGSK